MVIEVSVYKFRFTSSVCPCWSATTFGSDRLGRTHVESFVQHERSDARQEVRTFQAFKSVADLMIYLRSLPVLRSKSATFGMGEPEQGQLVFERSCESCHSFGPSTGKRIDLLQRGAPQAVTGYIAAMWNHAELMRAMSGANASPTGRNHQETSGRQFPKLDAEGMSNLVAFLFSESYFFERGNAARGRGVFESKTCARCTFWKSPNWRSMIESGLPKGGIAPGKIGWPTTLRMSA
jgi:hypothetical protein